MFLSETINFYSDTKTNITWYQTPLLPSLNKPKDSTRYRNYFEPTSLGVDPPKLHWSSSLFPVQSVPGRQRRKTLARNKGSLLRHPYFRHQKIEEQDVLLNVGVLSLHNRRVKFPEVFWTKGKKESYINRLYNKFWGKWGPDVYIIYRGPLWKQDWSYLVSSCT